MTNIREPERKRNPRFHILDPNPLLGNRAIIVFDSEMSRSICELIEDLAEKQELTQDQQHFYAFSKRLRAHYFKQKEMFSERDNGKSFSNKPDSFFV